MAADLSFEEGLRVWYPENDYYWMDASIFKISESESSGTPDDQVRALLRDEHYVNVYYAAGDNPAARAVAIRARAGDGSARNPVASVGSSVGFDIARGTREDTHGPYLLSRVTVEAFERISAEAGLLRLIDWLEDDGKHPLPPAEQLESDLSRILESVTGADAIFWLKDLGEDAYHAAWSVTDPFIELVAVNLARRTVTLVAAGGE